MQEAGQCRLSRKTSTFAGVIPIDMCVDPQRGLLTRYARLLAVCFEHSRLREQGIAERRRDDSAFELWLHGRLLGAEISLVPAQAYAGLMK